MLPMTALTALAMRSELLALPITFGDGVLSSGRFVVASVLSCLCRVSV